MKRAIITGATGAIGTALINELIKNNIEVLVLCRKDSVRNDRIPKHKLVTMKYCDLDQLSSLNNETNEKYDVFYHFAWKGTFGEERNDMYLQNSNIKTSLDAVEAAKRFGCDVFIGAGSQAEYGRVDNGGMLRPDTPAFPENGYGIAKLCSGQMTREHAHKLGMKHIWVRILSVYGPNDGINTMVMSTINKLKNGEIPQFTKGEQKWDYLYSGDAARAFYLLGSKGKDGKTYVLGSGKATALANYIEEIRNIVSPEGKIELGAIPYNNRQVMYLCADIKELTSDTGWMPETTFEEGIRSVVNTI